MIQYGSPEDLRAWMDLAEVPPLATVRLRHATGLVLDATAAAVYSVDSTGQAREGTPAASALLEATLTQAEAWTLADVDPRKGREQRGRVIESKSLGAKSVKYAIDGAAEAEASALASGQHLVPAAWAILRNAGLITSAVDTGAWDGHGRGIVHVGARELDPVTGELGPEVGA